MTDGDTWADMCVRVPIVKPPKLSDVLFDDDEEGGQTDGQIDGQIDEQIEGQTEGPKRKRKRRDSDKSEIRRINPGPDGDIDDLDRSLFPETERIFSQPNQELSNSKFFDIQVLGKIKKMCYLQGKLFK